MSNPCQHLKSYLRQRDPLIFLLLITANRFQSSKKSSRALKARPLKANHTPYSPACISPSRHFKWALERCHLIRRCHFLILRRNKFSVTWTRKWWLSRERKFNLINRLNLYQKRSKKKYLLQLKESLEGHHNLVCARRREQMLSNPKRVLEDQASLKLLEEWVGLREKRNGWGRLWGSSTQEWLISWVHLKPKEGSIF